MLLRNLCGVSLLVGLSACGNPQYLLHPASNPQAADARRLVDEVVETTILQPVRLGAYLSPTEGHYFRPVEPLDSRNAIIYVYRPHSKWNAQELQAPGFFLNGTFIYGLKNAGYFWAEVPAGTYMMVAKRPLAVIYFKTIFELPLTVEGGKSYFFRYDEEDLAPTPKKNAPPPAPDALVHLGPLKQMPNDQGMREIEGTVLQWPGLTLAQDQTESWTPFELYPNATEVSASNIEADKAPPAQGRPASLRGGHRVWWNPMTWDPDRESWF